MLPTWSYVQQPTEQGASEWWNHTSTTSPSVFKGAGRQRSNLPLIEMAAKLVPQISLLSPTATLISFAVWIWIFVYQTVSQFLSVSWSLRNDGCLGNGWWLDGLVYDISVVKTDSSNPYFMTNDGPKIDSLWPQKWTFWWGNCTSENVNVTCYYECQSTDVIVCLLNNSQTD